MKIKIVLLICLFVFINVNASFTKFKAMTKLEASVKKDSDVKPKPQAERSCEDGDNSDEDDYVDSSSKTDGSGEDKPSKHEDCDDDKPKDDDCDGKDKGKKDSSINKSKDNMFAVKGKGKCTYILPAIAPAPRDLQQVVKYLKSQKCADDMLCNVAKSEIEIAKKSAEMAKGYNCEERTMSGLQLIKKYGFKPEEHTIHTEDGYILTLHRICGTKTGDPVLLMNPFLGSTDDYITPGMNCLAYELSRAGYDVYCGNARGNKYSSKHKKLSAKCQEYWDFSWDEIGRYDLPAIIDYILKFTGRKKLHYVGWSQGTTSFFVMCSTRPEYNEKIACMHALSPVAYIEHCKSPVLRLMGVNTDVMYSVAKLLGSDEMDPNSRFLKIVTEFVCSPNPISNVVCSNFLMILAGFDEGQTNFTNLPINLGHTPAGSSTKQLIHYAQGVTSGKFRNFDYGKLKNKEVYGCDSPPDYPLHKITAPVALYYGTEDWFASVTDVHRLKKELANVVLDYCIDKYNHMDYVWGLNAKEKVNKEVLKLMKKYPMDNGSGDCND